MFLKYNSIINEYESNRINRIRREVNNTEVYTVEEKIHGGNFSFITDGSEIVCAKRTGIITQDEDFFNYHPVLERYRENILNLYKTLQCVYSGVIRIQVYGEFFGGGYPHPDVKAIPTAQLVQKKLFYSPDNEFVGFDICLVFNEIEDDNLNIDVTERRSLLTEHGIPTTLPLFEGTLNECLEFDPLFLTTIPKLLGYPDIENNYAEGVVIRPLKNQKLTSGSKVIIKHKNHKYKERVPRAPEEVKDIDPKFIPVLDMVNENRIDAILSKGEVSICNEDIGKIIQLTYRDIFDEMERLSPGYITGMTKTEKRSLNKYINQDIITLLYNSYLYKK